MQIKDTYTVSAPHEKVWEYFTDPEFLQQCIPGCDELIPLGDDTFEAILSVGISSIKGVYKGKVKLENKQPPSAYRLVVHGESKIGFVNGSCHFTLEGTQPDQTEVTLDGELMVGGKLARVGQRIIGGAAKLMIGQFFKGVAKLAQSEMEPSPEKVGDC